MRFRGIGGFAASTLVAGAILWSFMTTDVEFSRLLSAGPRIAEFLGRMFPPDPTVMREIMKGGAETLRIAILGPLPGIIAVAFHATGMLAKFYAEAIDGVSRAPIAALESAGAGPLARLRHAIWPQMAPVIARDTIFRFELNLRESLILGIVGAGGIGFYIQTYVRSFQYDKAASVTLAVIIMVVAIEAINVALRRRFA